MSLSRASLFPFILALAFPCSSIAAQPVSKCASDVLRLIKNVTRSKPDIQLMGLFVQSLDKIRALQSNVQPNLDERTAMNIWHSLVLLRALQIDLPPFDQFFEQEDKDEEARLSLKRNLEVLAHFIIINHASLIMISDPAWENIYKRKLRASVDRRGRRNIMGLTRMAISHQRSYWRDFLEEKLNDLEPKIEELIGLNEQLYRQGSAADALTVHPPAASIVQTADWIADRNVEMSLLRSDTDLARSAKLIEALKELEADLSCSPDPHAQDLGQTISSLFKDLEKIIWPSQEVLGPVLSLVEVRYR